MSPQPASLTPLSGRSALDRIGRGAEAGEADQDPRLGKIREALEVLGDASGGRAERIQQIFSLEYDSGWERPTPR